MVATDKAPLATIHGDREAGGGIQLPGPVAVLVGSSLSIAQTILPAIRKMTFPISKPRAIFLANTAPTELVTSPRHYIEALCSSSPGVFPLFLAMLGESPAMPCPPQSSPEDVKTMRLGFGQGGTAAGHAFAMAVMPRPE